MNIGVLGGGQLARMLAQAGSPLGMELTFLDPSAHASASSLAHQLKGDYQDGRLLEEMLQTTQLITYEFENVPSESLALLHGKATIYPPPQALANGQDRLAENRLFQRLDIAVPDFRPVDDLDGLSQAIEQIGTPGILKCRREGYDGKGQAVIRHPAEAMAAWDGIQQVPAIYEQQVAFEREVSIIAVRSQTGETRTYPLTENIHRHGILRQSVACQADPMQQMAESFINRLLSALDYVGVLALELFQQNGQLLANEFAPRVHNSGHWTIEGAETSQFENHLRAIAGLPLGSTRLLCPCAMLNCIGKLPPLKEVMAIDGAHLHDYRKHERPGRKVGHIGLRAQNAADLQQALQRLNTVMETPTGT
jgi:5-(carboxyamino)imidazole ribonucleotide synthase